MMKKVLAGALVAAATFSIAPGPAAHASGFGEVRGKVFDTVTGKPDKLACVIIWIQDGVNPPVTVNVNPLDGTYDAVNVATGAWPATAYDCVTVPKHWPAMYGGPTPAPSIPGVNIGGGALVNVIDGIATTGVDFGLGKAAITRITVKDSKTKKTIPNVSICPYQVPNQFQFAFCGGTDGAGKGVPIYSPPGSMRLQINDNRSSGTNPSPPGYPVGIWIGGADFASATTFTVASGANPPFNLLYDPLPAGSRTGEVTGTITDKVTGLPLAGACATAWGTTIVASAPTSADGTFDIVGVENGNVEISAGDCDHVTGTHTNVVYRNHPGLDTSKQKLVRVLVGTVTPNINFALPLAGQILVHVVDANTGLPIDGAGVTPYKSALNTLGGQYQTGFGVGDWTTGTPGDVLLSDLVAASSKLQGYAPGYESDWYGGGTDFTLAKKVHITVGANPAITIAQVPQLGKHNSAAPGIMATASGGARR